MKKFFALLTALVLCAALFTGAALAEDENLASAKGLLDFWYKNKSRDKLTQTAEDYEVPAQLMIDGVACATSDSLTSARYIAFTASGCLVAKSFDTI